jgi:outer membrane protein OmpA-like peptidoglycan-associated protein
VKYLLSKGISNTYVGSNYYGEEDPAVPNTSIENRRKNRRVEFEEATIVK